jgi:predicted negative regulator of RcsB-dependent stress response
MHDAPTLAAWQFRHWWESHFSVETMIIIFVVVVGVGLLVYRYWYDRTHKSI